MGNFGKMFRYTKKIAHVYILPTHTELQRMLECSICLYHTASTTFSNFLFALYLQGSGSLLDRHTALLHKLKYAGIYASYVLLSYFLTAYAGLILIDVRRIHTALS